MLTVINDLFIAADAGDLGAFVIPVDISAACDTEGRGFLLKTPRKVGWCHNR